MLRTAKASGDERPPFSYTFLTVMAISNSPKKRLQFPDIFRFITERFPYYQENNEKWRKAIRHNLTVNDYFLKLPWRGLKGSYWALHPHAHHMFDNGSMLRRQTRFKLNKSVKDSLNEAHAALSYSFFVSTDYSTDHPSSFGDSGASSVQPTSSILTNSSPVTPTCPLIGLPQGTTGSGYPSETQVRSKRSFTIESLLASDEKDKPVKQATKADESHLRTDILSTRQFQLNHPISPHITAVPFIQCPHPSFYYHMPIHSLQLTTASFDGGIQPSY